MQCLAAKPIAPQGQIKLEVEVEHVAAESCNAMCFRKIQDHMLSNAAGLKKKHCLPSEHRAERMSRWKFDVDALKMDKHDSLNILFSRLCQARG